MNNKIPQLQHNMDFLIQKNICYNKFNTDCNLHLKQIEKISAYFLSLVWFSISDLIA